MKSKFFYFGSSVLILSIIFSFTVNTGNNGRNKQLPITVVTGDEPRNPNSKIFTGNIDAAINQKPYTSYHTDSIISITDVYTGVTSLYDLQSNAVTQHLVQWGNGDTLHAVFTRNMTPGLLLADRRVYYAVSEDKGVTWTNLGETYSAPNGFPAVDLLSDGRALVASHPDYNNQGTHTVLFKDLIPLLGSFTACDPQGWGGPGVTARVWPRIVTTPSNKVIFCGAYNPTGGADTTVFLNSLTNETNCTFSGWQSYSAIDNAEQYSFARAENGKIGLAYITNDFVIANAGDVHYITSTDDGLTWSTPTVVYDATPNPDQYLGALRSVDLVYVGNTPKVTFGLIWENSAGNYYPGFNGRIMFWSPDVNGGNASLLADSTLVPDNPIQSASAINDVYVNICRATIGKSKNEQLLYCAFSVARQETSPNADSTPYFDVYLAWSNNQGTSWQGFNRLTNFSGPLKDCRYPCLAPVNDNDPNFYYANIEYQNDSIPGSATNGAAESPAQQHFIRVKMPSLIGVQSIGTEVPKSYNLSQNFPNPFNPSTKIRFALPSSEFVTLKVYDITGKEVATLVNEKLQAGLKELDFNAGSLASGIYFYSLVAGDFKETKKMVLLK